MKFILLLFSMFIVLSVGAVGIKSTDIKKTDSLDHQEETLSIGCDSVTDLHVDVGKINVLIYSLYSDNTKGKDQSVLIVTKLPKTRLANRRAPEIPQDETTNIILIAKPSITVRNDKRLDPGNSQDIAL